jgi:hypothetical protein
MKKISKVLISLSLIFGLTFFGGDLEPNKVNAEIFHTTDCPGGGGGSGGKYMC